MEDSSHSPSPLHTSPNPASNTAVVTIFAENPSAEEEEDLPPDSKRIQLSPASSNGPVINSAGIMAAAAAAASSSNSNSSLSNNPLSNHEEHAVRQLITGEQQGPVMTSSL